MNTKLVILGLGVLIVVIGVVSFVVLNNQNALLLDSRCLITVSGDSYDVTQLRNTHTGGDMFNCGTDMTTEFVEEHGSRYSMIEPYKV